MAFLSLKQDMSAIYQNNQEIKSQFNLIILFYRLNLPKFKVKVNIKVNVKVKAKVKISAIYHIRNSTENLGAVY